MFLQVTRTVDWRSGQWISIPLGGKVSEFTIELSLPVFPAVVNEMTLTTTTGLLARRILNGDRKLPAKPVPIERIKITVNLKTAKFMGIELPKEMNHLIDETY